MSVRFGNSRLFALVLVILAVTSPAPRTLAQEGRLDQSFGTAGKVFNLLPGSATDVGVQADRAIVIAGWAYGPDGIDLNFQLTRLRTDGSLDTSFGAGGVTQTDISGGDEASRLVLLPDGRILVAGLTNLSGILPSTDARPLIALARYTPDGALDASFGTGGFVITDLADRFGAEASHRVTDLAVDADGSIYVAGSIYENPALGNDHPASFLITRFLLDGTLDPSFGDGGAVITGVPAETDASLYLALQPDGVIAAGGYESDGQRWLSLLRYDLDGNIDAGFGAGSAGPVSLGGVSFLPVGLSILPDGAIMVAGGAETESEKGVAVARFDADGSLDLTYASNGLAFAPLSDRVLAAGPITDVYAADALFDQDGSVLIGGSVEAANRDFFLMRFEENGRLDERFGTDGLVTTDFDNGFDALRGLTRQSDGSAVAVGYEFKVARYLTDTDTSTDAPPAAPAILLEPPFPNPFHGEATIRFTLAQPGQVRLLVYDMLGREVALLADGVRGAGTYAETFHAQALSAGLYLLRLEANGALRTQPVVLVRPSK